jgi:UDP-glucuronate decarboxylase
MAVNDGRVVSNFIVQAINDEDITIYGDGKQTRSFCYVDDLIDGLTKLFFSNYSQGPVNIGNPQEVSIIELAQEIISLTGSASKIVSKALPKDDPKNRLPDITIAKNHLGWNPKIDRIAGLRHTISYFERILVKEGEVR